LLKNDALYQYELRDILRVSGYFHAGFCYFFGVGYHGAVFLKPLSIGHFVFFLGYLLSCKGLQIGLSPAKNRVMFAL
jgi:hypothetical protein